MSETNGPEPDPEEATRTQALTRALDEGLSGEGDRRFAPGQWLGPYRLKTLLGRGGMGSVWLAEQTEPVTREVALKLIHGKLLSSSAIARFEIERQVLARMSHPAIAHVYDAGTTDLGHPWLAMEYVPGEPITRFCDRHRLSTRQRLQLFMRACFGVQHAHQKGILHRDLKPANILVTEVDGEPMPKIIDFGIAVTDHSDPDNHSGPIAGTPGYMSPEQADPDGCIVDTRSDIYALGLILFELLTGERAMPRELSETPLDQIHERLRTRELLVPSQRLSKTDTASGKTATGHDARTDKLIRRLRGELDWIVIKATELERERRYASAQELAADIQRFLDHQPVEAVPGGRGYRAVKFIRRNRAAVTGAAAAFAALTVGLVAALTAMVQTDRARAEAERSRAELGEVVKFQQRMIGELDPEAMGMEILDVLVERLHEAGIERDESRGLLGLAGGTEVARQVLIGQMLEPSARALEATIHDGAAAPSLQATLAEAYDMAGAYKRARELLEQAVDAREQNLGPRHPETLEAKHRLAEVLHTGGRSDEAKSLLNEVIGALREVSGHEAEQTLLAEFTLGFVELRTGHPEVAARRLDRVVAGLERVDAGHGRLPRARIWLASALANSGDNERAREEGRKAAETVLALPPEQQDHEHIDVLRIYGGILTKAGDVAGGARLLRQTLELATSRLGDRHPETANVKNDLALALEGLSRHDEALALMEDAREIYRMVFGQTHRAWLAAQNNLALLYSSKGEADRAVEVTRGMISDARRMLDPENHELIIMEYNFGARLLRADRIDEAVEQLEQVHDIARKVHGDEHEVTLLAASRLVTARFRQGNIEQALELADTTMPKAREVFGERHRKYVNVMLRWAELLATHDRERARKAFDEIRWVLTAEEQELHDRGIDRWRDDIEALAEELAL